MITAIVIGKKGPAETGIEITAESIDEILDLAKAAFEATGFNPDSFRFQSIKKQDAKPPIYSLVG